jgi:secreted trypsin-like serine protease
MIQVDFGVFKKGVSMSNFDTRFINFLTLLLVLGLMSGLSACQPSKAKLYNPTQVESIIGGEESSVRFQFSNRVIYLALGAEKTKTPFGFTIRQKSNCTASALSPTLLITAAHCVLNLKASEIFAVLSSTPWDQPAIDEDWIQVSKIKIHEGFYNDDKNNISNDLALLKLSKEISTDRISKLALQTQISGSSFDLLAAGYGRTTAEINPVIPQKNPQLNSVLKHVENFDPLALTFQMDQADLKGICSGDSGGPGFIYDADTKEFYILGIASFVSIYENEKKQRDPRNLYNSCIGHGNYTNLLLYQDWIIKSSIDLGL